MSMVNTCAGADILGDDALREVFSCLPGLRDLLCCAATCKRWRRLVADRDFLRCVGLWPDTARRPCILAGSFSQTYYFHGNPRIHNTTAPYAPPRFFSLQASLDVHPLTFDSFLTVDGHDNKRLFDVARPPAARRGFLLTRVLLPSSSPARLRLAVCRPLLDTRSAHFLPPPFHKPLFTDDSNIAGCAIITAADHAPAASFSLVTIQGQDQAVANLWTSQEQDEDGLVRVWQNSQLAMLGNVRIDMIFFAESRGALLVEQGGAFSTVDLKSKEKMPVRLKDERTTRLRGTSWFRTYSCSSTCCHGHFGSTCVYTTPVLYEIDWAFMSNISSQV